MQKVNEKHSYIIWLLQEPHLEPIINLKHINCTNVINR